MATDKSDNKDWRGGRRGARGASGSSQENAPGYMRVRDKSDKGIANAYWRNVALWGVLFLGLAGYLVYWLLFWPVRPPLLIATITQYDYPLPPNAWTEEDQELLLGLDGNQKIVRCGMEKDGKGEVADYNAEWYGLSEKAAFGKLEAKLREAEENPGGPSKNVVMLYISMHGAVRGDGEPCLIPPGPFAHDSSKWFSARNLLDQLFSGKAKKRVKYLVFFDCSRVDTDWNLGWLYAGFPQRLGEKVQELAINNLYVITSSSPGQISWTAPELKGSVFARFLYRGLQGKADRFGGNSDRVVTLSELFRHLSVNVSDWVKTHRDDEQTPMLFGKDGQIDIGKLDKKDDFAVVAVPVDSGDEAPATDSTDSSGHWDEIAKAWELHKKLHDSGIPRRSPLKWHEYQHRLLYLEQLALAGKVGEGKIRDQFMQVNRLADVLQKHDLEESWPGYSLPQVKSRLEELKQQAAAVLKLANAAAAGSDAVAKPQVVSSETAVAKPLEKAAAKQQAEAAVAKPQVVAGDTKTKENLAEKPSEQSTDYLTSAEAVWLRFAGAGADSSLFSLLESLPPLPDPMKADLVEIHFLRMLKEYLGQAANNDLRLAVKSRKLAEEAALPKDLRAQYAIYGIMQQADRQRRLAEDRLFVGGIHADHESPRSYWDRANASEGYGGALQSAEEVADAFRVRDEALAEIPCYARWLLHRCQRDVKLENQLHDLLEKANAFSTSLDRTLQDYSDAAAAKYVWPKDRIAAKSEIARLLKALKAEFDAECTRLDKRNEGSPKDEFRRLGVVLSVSLESGERRNRLRARYSEILAASAKAVTLENREKNAADAQDKTSAKPEQAAAANLLARWPTHPALLILGEPLRARPHGDLAADLAAQGGQVRAKLNEALDETRVAAWRQKSQDALLDPKTAPLAVRSGYAEGDRELRSVAALWAGREMRDADLSTDLYRVDRRNLLLWQAQRTLDDFWGPKPGESRPYFQSVAEEYLLAANALTPPSPLARKVQQLADEVAQRGVVRPDVVQGIYLDANSNGGDSPQVDLKLDVASAASGLFEAGGEAAVFFQDQKQRPLAIKDRLDAQESVLRHAIVSPEVNPVHLKTYLNLGENARDVNAVLARTVYRGHVQSAPIQVVRLSGPETVVTRTQRLPPTVLVTGASVRKTSIIFIFDCSGSMNTPDVDLGVEVLKKEREEERIKDKGNKKTDVANTRIYWARKQLNRILEELARKPNQYRVGLLTYGSRYAFHPDVPNDRARKKEFLLTWKENSDKPELVTDPAKLKDADPDTDYQVLLDLNDFNENQRILSQSKLEVLKPLGQTPLYYTVIKAIEMLEKDAENKGPKRVIVITDGINQQTSLCDYETLKIDVEHALERAKETIKDIRVEVIPFCIKPDPGQNEDKYRMALKDLESLVKGQNPPGDFVARNDPSRLLDALEKLVETEKFVLSRGGQEISQLESEKRRELDLPASGKCVPYTISIKEGGNFKANAEIEVEGGEFIKLYLDASEAAGKPRLIFRSKEEKLEQEASLPDHAWAGDGKSRYYVKADRGTKDGDLVTFRISLQNADETKFSCRPKSVLAQIIPVLPGEIKKDPYTFHDSSFQNGCGFPVLQFCASGWPKEATKAKVLLWFKFLPTNPDEQLSLNDDRWKKIGDWKALELHPQGQPSEKTVVLKVKIEEKDGDPSCTVVAEQSVPADMNPHTYKIEIKPAENSAGSGPDKVHCRSLLVSGQPGKVIHRFVFNIKPSDIWNYRICVTSQKNIQSNACSPPPELEVHVD